ncbi:TPA: carbon storage regulator [Legionella pneumophila]|nr:carbon storage regulator [Legionella pneumophila]HAU0349921.1 carbon storage regulator [Legionella pneumophila]HAU0353412.1 carbon storage regulator [Legionella pneumophila]HAU0359501.1 carbon storage regulator [Legionella pneumophila]HAU0368058.1 carbon storage regulator [Legionella pneumophila]
MLKIFRKAGEEVHIGGDIRVVVLSNNGERVSLGIQAPRDVEVLRGELLINKTSDIAREHIEKMISEFGERLSKIENAVA